MKRLMPALATALLTALGFWLGGADLTVRGPTLVSCYIMSITTALFVYFVP